MTLTLTFLAHKGKVYPLRQVCIAQDNDLILMINFNSCMYCRPTLSHSLTAKGIMYCVITKGSQDAMKQGISKQSI